MSESLNQDYWIKRAEAAIIYGEKSALEYERILKKSYEATKKSIEKEIQAFYSKYSTENNISLAEARRRLSPNELKDFNFQLKVYLDEIDKLGSTPMTKEYKAYLKTLSGKAYISRLEELSNNIRYNIEKLSASHSKSLEGLLRDSYESSYYITMFNFQNQAKIGISFTMPGGEQAQTAAREKWLGQNYSDRIWANKQKLVSQLTQVLSQEFVRGSGPIEVSEELSKRLDVSRSNAQRLVRTEMNYISNKATMKVYADSNVKEYQYVATLDARTSEICRDLDNKIFKVKEASVGINQPPMHPNCRSTTIPYFEDDDIGKAIDNRVARNEDGTGKTIELGEDISFFDWVEKYGSQEFQNRAKKTRDKFLRATNSASFIRK